MANNPMKTFLAAALVLSLFPSCTKTAWQNVPDPVRKQGENIVYEYDESNFCNPERGWYSLIGYTFKNGKVPSPVSPQVLKTYRSDSKKITLLLMEVFLCDFMHSDISQEALNVVSQGLANFREAGVKAIMRFAYSWTGTEVDDEKEAPEDVILRHIEQLKPILREYQDVIYLVQTGFIGSYGEWAGGGYTTHFENNDEGRRRVALALLDAIPVNRQMALRTPGQKMMVLNCSPKDTITAATAFDGSNASRIAGHNDCFLASGNDAGTFSSITHRKFWKNETKYTIMGGETCLHNEEFCNCTNALKDLEAYHWSYLNYGSVIDVWKRDQCEDEILCRIGYRLYLKEGTFSSEKTAGSKMYLDLKLVNCGFASIMNERELYFVLRDMEDKTKAWTYKTDIDPRSWQGGTENDVNIAISLPEDLVAGRSYSIYLELPDIAPELYRKSEFSIRLANKNVWDSESGMNKIYTFVAK